MCREKMKRWIMPGVLAIFLMLSIILGCGLFQSGPLEVGDRAPDFGPPTIDGQTVELSELRGQPVLVNFWATWCGPCIAEMPYLQASFEEKGAEVKFIAINLGEDVGKVRQFAQDRGLSFTIALGTEEIREAYNIRYIPTTFIIDEQGVIRHIKIGAFRSKDEVITLLESL
jgi:peroxiredoxin